MVREFTELQGTMGGIYAREEGRTEEVWKAVYYHYLPVGVEAEGPPTRGELGKAALTWAAVSLADKLDTLAGLFAAGEKPTGSRDPYGLRRAAHGVFRILIDLPELTGLTVRLAVGSLAAAAAKQHGGETHLTAPFDTFLRDRLRYALEQRGFDTRNVQAVLHNDTLAEVVPLDARRKLEVLPEFTGSQEFRSLAVAFKRVRNIARELPKETFDALEASGSGPALSEEAERGLQAEIDAHRPVIDAAITSGDGYREAFAAASRVKPAVDRFFDNVLVMAPEPEVRQARLWLLRRLEALILRLADISAIVPEDTKPA
jgi:glycyl-tRNA synthetase beta chain